MNRLTNESNVLDALKDDSFALMCFLKLKKYEDLGHSPEELAQIIHQNKTREKIIRSVRIEVIEHR